MGILANLVSYNGSSIEWDASAVLGGLAEGLVTAVQFVLVCYIMIVGVRWFLRTVRFAPDPADDDWDGPYEGQYSWVEDDAETDDARWRSTFPEHSSLPAFATTEKAMNYYMGRDSGGSLKDERKTDMYLWDGNSRMGALAGPKGYLP